MNMEASNQRMFHSIVWAALIPQLILLILHIDSWFLVQGEASQEETTVATWLFVLQLGFISLLTGVAILVRFSKLAIGLVESLVSLVLYCGYLFLLTNFKWDAIPDTIQPWILNEENVARWIFTLSMPGAFLSLYLFTREFFQRFSSTNTAMIVLASTIGAPVAWYVLVSIMQPFLKGQISVTIMVVLGVALVIVFLMGLIKAFDALIFKPFANNFDARYTLIVALLGLAAPLGGLWLNRFIPFPVDFQSASVYAFTVFNAFVLLMKPQGQRYSELRLFLRCVTFPFIAYFFLVFLPFLPLSLIAVLAMGTGFLMLTPLALGLFQGRITLREFQLVRDKSSAVKAASITMVGLLILPLYFTMQAIFDRQALDTSLNYFYAHDAKAEPLTDSQISRAATTLVTLRERKLSVQLPYIAGAYNRLVFGDMVLSDTKINRMYSLLTGETLPDVTSSFFGRSGRSRQRFLRGFVVPPNQDVSLEDLSTIRTAPGERTIRLTLKNNSDDTHSMFVEEIIVPEGVFISGLRLKIDEQWQDARVFDRKTAIWVFQKITEIRRDPALLFYRSPGLVELRVYPFPAQGIREVELDFIFHPEIKGLINVGQTSIDLTPDVDSPSIVSDDGNVLLSESMYDYTFERTPYLHFILDYSQSATATTEDYAKRIFEVVQELGISTYRLSAANIQSVAGPLMTSTHLKDIEAAIRQLALSRTGGLWFNKAFADVIHAQYTSGEFTDIEQRPMFVLVTDSAVVEQPEAGNWQWRAPDVTHWYLARQESLELKAFTSHVGIDAKHSMNASSVIALNQGNALTLLPADRSSVYSNMKNSRVTVYRPSISQLTNLPTKNSASTAESTWSKAATLWTEWRAISTDPSVLTAMRRPLLARSRELGVLLPTTSMIVVESASQWVILERKEKHSLNNHNGLDFEEEQQTSEPVWWLLLLGLLAILMFRDKALTRRIASN